MIIIKDEKQIEILREGGKRLASVLRTVSKNVRPGISTDELDQIAYDEIKKLGDEPAFLNYRPEGALTPFPKTLCTSINNEIVHGIPSKNRILKEGDIISIDLGIKHKGMFTDHAVTVAVGEVSKEKSNLMHIAETALYAGIEMAKNGNTVGDISYAIESIVRPHNYGIVRELSGHGVGVKIHEDPYIPNYGKPGTGAKLRPGMVIAIEPMINLGKQHIITEDDDWTISTADGQPSAHFEHTILITEGEAEILTK
jgi:methionyl aminopeptidase